MPAGYDKLYYQQVWTEVIAALGGRCQECGFNDPRALVILGDDPEHRRITSWRHRATEILRDPAEYWLVCANCRRTTGRD